MKLSAFCGVSVDGFLARADDTFDFLSTGEQEPHGFKEFLSTVDVVVMGRRTFDVVRQLGHLGLYGGKPLIVLTRRPLEFSEATKGMVESMAPDPKDVRQQLEGRAFQHAYVDGGLTIQGFLATRCLDRIIVTRVPVLIGSGISLFGPVAADIPLRHVATRTYPGGLVQSEYEVGS